MRSSIGIRDDQCTVMTNLCKRPANREKKTVLRIKRALMRAFVGEGSVTGSF